jgi:hypothetical protein
MFARLAVQRRGGHAHPIMWEFAEGRDIASQRQRVVSQVELAVDELTAGSSRLELTPPEVSFDSSIFAFGMATDDMGVDERDQVGFIDEEFFGNALRR